MSNDYLKKILTARVYDVAQETPLELANTLSQRIDNRIYFKREDMQSVFSFKLRGAYNKMAHLTPAQLKRTYARLARCPAVADGGGGRTARAHARRGGRCTYPRHAGRARSHPAASLARTGRAATRPARAGGAVAKFSGTGPRSHAAGLAGTGAAYRGRAGSLAGFVSSCIAK
nr:pyridoxal-phosphate dependent enzyme [Herbaspirillum huttiense]